MAANLSAWLRESQPPRARTRRASPRPGAEGAAAMPDRPPDQRFDGADSVRGSQQPAGIPAGGERENGSRPPAEPGIAGVRGRERLLIENDQTLSDTDQTSSDSDQTSAERDQVAADCDQAASDRDLGAGADPREHEITRAIRERTSHEREQTARARLDAAYQQATGRADFGMQIIERAAEHRQRATEYRAQAAEHRVLAAEERRAAAEDREHAAEERLRAQADREMSVAEFATAETDPLTGSAAANGRAVPLR
jgi:hypothetical protein